MMLQQWMGSDYTNDDLVKESSVVYDYTHTIASEEKLGTDTAYKIELAPKPKAPVTWDKLVLWIRKDDFVPLREEFYAEHKGRDYYEGLIWRNITEGKPVKEVERENKKRLEVISRLSLKDLEKVRKQYIRPERFARVLVEPE